MKNVSNWYVVTGGPSAGKTTLIQALEGNGLHVEHESARILIDEEVTAGKTIEEIRNDEQRFQEMVYYHKVGREARLHPNQTIFFDRGIPDTYAYNKLHGFFISQEMRTVIDNVFYKKVFLLEPFKYEQDYARVESLEQRDKLFDLLKEAYEKSNTPIEVVPAFPAKEERIAYFLDLLRNREGINIPE